MISKEREARQKACPGSAMKLIHGCGFEMPSRLIKQTKSSSNNGFVDRCGVFACPLHGFVDRCGVFA